MPAGWTPASASTDASGVPAHFALPMPPSKNGRPVLPEHSMVNITSCRARALRSASVNDIGWSTRPLTSSFQSASFSSGRLKCLMTKNLSVGVCHVLSSRVDQSSC